jgi:hypothetical protein
MWRLEQLRGGHVSPLDVSGTAAPSCRHLPAAGLQGGHAAAPPHRKVINFFRGVWILKKGGEVFGDASRRQNVLKKGYISRSKGGKVKDKERIKRKLN